MFEMNEKQKALFDTLTQLQRRMALNSIAGMKPAENHKDAGGVCKNEPDRRKLASEILTNPDVEAFLDSMKSVAVNEAIMSRDRMLELLSLVADIDASDLDKLSTATITELKGGFDVKLKAMKQLAELAGYDAPIKTDNNHIIKASDDEW